MTRYLRMFTKVGEWGGCFGDSGGPLVLGDELVGIFSWMETVRVTLHLQKIKNFLQWVKTLPLVHVAQDFQTVGLGSHIFMIESLKIWKKKYHKMIVTWLSNNFFFTFSITFWRIFYVWCKHTIVSIGYYPNILHFFNIFEILLFS